MKIDEDMIISCFKKYIEHSTGKKPPSQKEFLQNIQQKENDPAFLGDIEALLRHEVNYDSREAFDWLKRFSQKDVIMPHCYGLKRSPDHV